MVAARIAHGCVRGEVVFVSCKVCSKPDPLSSLWRTLRIQFRNCADLWTTAAVLCQRPLETVQRTIKVIGSEWGGKRRVWKSFSDRTRQLPHTGRLSPATTFFVTQIGPAGVRTVATDFDEVLSSAHRGKGVWT